MIVHNKVPLLRHQSLLRLRLTHAAFVESFPLSKRDSAMPVNRLLCVCRNDRRRRSMIREPQTGATLPLRAGHVFFIPCRHVVEVHLEPDLHYVSLHFNLDYIYGFDIFDGHPRCETLMSGKLVATVRDMIGRPDSIKTLLRINELVFHLCAQWYRCETRQIHAMLLRSRAYAVALEFVRDKGNATTTVKMLAGMCNMRQDVFSRKFTRDMGITPKNFILQHLVRKTGELLLRPDTPVKEVAGALNFSSEYYFSNFFKHHTGLTPTGYKITYGNTPGQRV